LRADIQQILDPLYNQRLAARSDNSQPNYTPSHITILRDRAEPDLEAATVTTTNKPSEANKEHNTDTNIPVDAGIITSTSITGITKQKTAGLLDRTTTAGPNNTTPNPSDNRDYIPVTTWRHSYISHQTCLSSLVFLLRTLSCS
jgi:hypothetical protein